MKAFVANRVGDAGMLLAMMAIFSAFGTLAFYGQSNGITGYLDADRVPVYHRPTKGHIRNADTFKLWYFGANTGASPVEVLPDPCAEAVDPWTGVRIEGGVRRRVADVEVIRGCFAPPLQDRGGPRIRVGRSPCLHGACSPALSRRSS